MKKIVIIIIFLGQTVFTCASFAKEDETENDGFKLQSVKQGSTYDKIGLKKGDVLTGFKSKISSPQLAMSVYQGLKDGSVTEVEVKRDGKIITIKPEAIKK